ncbi:MAG: fasciclin domain-containing protein [Myxococcaceae bacterium]
MKTLFAAALLSLSTAAIAAEPKDVVDTAVAAGEFNTLAKLLTDAGLVSALKGAGPFTVFAPTDAAFAKIPAADLAALAKDKEKLKAVLTYHVVPAKVTAAEVLKMKDGTKVKTVSGKEFVLGLKSGKVTVDGANVVKTDVAASNGVIHVIDSVIIHKS